MLLPVPLQRDVPEHLTLQAPPLIAPCWESKGAASGSLGRGEDGRQRLRRGVGKSLERENSRKLQL